MTDDKLPPVCVTNGLRIHGEQTDGRRMVGTYIRASGSCCQEGGPSEERSLRTPSSRRRVLSDVELITVRHVCFIPPSLIERADGREKEEARTRERGRSERESGAETEEGWQLWRVGER